MKITIAGIGYVGLSNSILLAQNNEVVAIDISQEKVEMINNKISPIEDNEIKEYLKNGKLNLTATTDKEAAYKDASYVIISTPTNYDTEKNYFDTKTVETVVYEPTLKENEFFHSRVIKDKRSLKQYPTLLFLIVCASSFLM